MAAGVNLNAYLEEEEQHKEKEEANQPNTKDNLTRSGENDEEE